MGTVEYTSRSRYNAGGSVTMIDWTTTDAEAGMRLDLHVADRMGVTRSRAQSLIAAGHVLVDGAPCRASTRTRGGEVICGTIPDAAPTEHAAEEIPLDIVYEDTDILVINKARGMVVHPAPGARSGTLVNAVLAHADDLSGIGGEERPGIVHRLDRDTTGLLVVAKNDAAHLSLQEQISGRTAHRGYVAIAWGHPRFERAIVDAPIGRHPGDRKKMAVVVDDRHRSRHAVTHLTVRELVGPCSLFSAELETGRTHQIRVHLKHIGHPVLADPVYGADRRFAAEWGPGECMAAAVDAIKQLGGQALHAEALRLSHPRTGEPMAFSAEPPADFRTALAALRALRRR